jgi:hypothetical protein
MGFTGFIVLYQAVTLISRFDLIRGKWHGKNKRLTFPTSTDPVGSTSARGVS